MRKWMMGFVVGLLVLMLAACGDEAQEPAKPKAGTDDARKSELTLEEVFEKAQAASEDLNSMHADMDIQQTIISPAVDEEINSTVNVQMDMVQEPLAMHQIMKMEVPEMGTMETELYMNESGFFMKNPEVDQWMKLPVDDFEGIMDNMGTNADASVDFSMLEEFIEDFTFEQTDDQYILNLKASGEKFKALVSKEFDGAGLAEEMGGEEFKEVLDDMTIHELVYEIFIDKKSFQTTNFNLFMDMEMGIEGEMIRMKQDVQAKISQLNEIKEIVIPQEVLDNVIEF